MKMHEQQARGFKNNTNFLNLWALKISTLYKSYLSTGNNVFVSKAILKFSKTYLDKMNLRKRMKKKEVLPILTLK